MKNLLSVFALIALFSSCKKEQAPAPTTNTIALACKCTPYSGVTLTGGLTYSTPAAANTSATLSNNEWLLTLNNVVLKTGDKYTISVNVVGNSDCYASVSVNGGVRELKRNSVFLSPGPPTNSFTVEYIVP